MSDQIDIAAASIGAEYGMTVSQVLQNIALGDIPHPEAAEHECGATSPKFPEDWCLRKPGHKGDHASIKSLADEYDQPEGDSQ